MGSIPSYSLIGTRGLREFVCAQTAEDRESTLQKLAHKGTLPPQYSVSFPQESLVSRVAWIALKILLFPLYLPYLGLQKLASIAVIPAAVFSNENLPEWRKNLIEPMRGVCTYPWNQSESIEANMARKAAFRAKAEIKDPRVKRFTIDVDGTPIDVCLLGKASTLSNGRWVLAAGGNGSRYEAMFNVTGGTTGIKPIPEQLADDLGANVIVFNYPGVGDSGGSPSPEMIEKAYKAVLLILEKEIQATQIIHYGWSMGGAAQALGLHNWIFNPNVQHVCIKDRTFSTLGDAAKDILGGGILGRIGKAAIRALGWEIDSQAMSCRLPCPEILLQTGWSTEYKYRNPINIGDCRPMGSKEEIQNDGMFSPSSTLAYALAGQSHLGRKDYLLTTCGHPEPDISAENLARKVRALLKAGRPDRELLPEGTSAASMLWRGHAWGGEYFDKAAALERTG